MGAGFRLTALQAFGMRRRMKALVYPPDDCIKAVLIP